MAKACNLLICQRQLCDMAEEFEKKLDEMFLKAPSPEMDMKFKEWFQKKLFVGAFAKNALALKANGYRYVINVSDEFYPDTYNEFISAGLKMFWFPMNECKRDIGLNSIYGAMVILRQAEKENEKVYLHCHAGVNRSPIVQAAYHYMRSGIHFEDRPRTGYLNMMLASCGRGYLPPKAEMEQFLTLLNKNLNDKMQGGILDTVKIDTINNF